MSIQRVHFWNGKVTPSPDIPSGACLPRLLSGLEYFSSARWPLRNQRQWLKSFTRVCGVDKRERKTFRSDFPEFKFWWNIWPIFLVQEIYPSSCLKVYIVLSVPHTWQLWVRSLKIMKKSFNIRRIFVQKNCLQILMVACKPLGWP